MTEVVFWDVSDADRLTHTSPEEAIVEYAEECYEADVPVLDWIKRVCPIEVSGYARKTVDPGFIASLAEDAVEHFTERVDEEYGDPEGDMDLFSQEEQKAFCMGLQLVFAQALSKATIWQWEVVEKRSFTAEQVESLLRSDCPEWFEEDADANRAA